MKPTSRATNIVEHKKETVNQIQRRLLQIFCRWMWWFRLFQQHPPKSFHKYKDMFFCFFLYFFFSFSSRQSDEQPLAADRGHQSTSLTRTWPAPVLDWTRGDGAS